MQKYPKDDVVDMLQLELLALSGNLQPDCFQHLVHRGHLLRRLQLPDEAFEGRGEDYVVWV